MKLPCVKKKYRISSYFRSIRNSNEKEGLIYHSLLGNAMLANAELITLLKRSPRQADLLNDKCAGISPCLFEHLRKTGLIVEAHTNDDCSATKVVQPENRQRSVNHLRLCLTDGCNMRCAYCYIGCADTPSYMSFEIAKTAILQYYRLLRKLGTKGKITIFGGEPLLNWPCLEKSVLFIRKLDTRRKHFTNLCVVTNATLVDKVKATFLAEHDVNIGVSLDGTKLTNDRVRVMCNGEGSYRYVVMGLRELLTNGAKNISLSCTVGNHNILVLKKLISFAAKRKIPISMHTTHAGPKFHPPSTDAKLVHSFFDAVLYAEKKGVALTGPWLWPVRKAFGSLGRLNHCAACGHELSIQPNGDIKPCPGFSVTYGTVFDFDGALASNKLRSLGTRRAPNIKGCHGCPIEGLCAGGCMLNAKAKYSSIFYKDGNCRFMRGMFEKIVRHYLNDVNKNRSANCRTDHN